MDAPQQAPTPHTLKLSKRFLWVLVPVLAVVALGAWAYLFWGYLQTTENDSQQAADTTTNLAGRLPCEIDEDCPTDFRCVSAYTVDGTEDRLCIRDVALTGSNTNGVDPFNANLNANRSDTVVNVAPVQAGGWQTVTYQESRHGFTIDIPDDWSSSTGSMGIEERMGMMYANSPSSGNDVYASVSVTFFRNDGSLDEWVEDHRSELERPGTTLVKESVRTAAGDGILFIATEGGEYPYVSVYAYVQRDDIVYEINSSESANGYQAYAGVIDEIIASLAFTDVLPLYEIVIPSSNVAIPENQGYELAITWRSTLEKMNFDDPMLDDDENWIWQRSYYKAGTITNGRYQGKDLVVILENPEGPAFAPSLYRVVYDASQKTFTYLEKHSNNLSYFVTPITYDVGSSIPDLDLPERIDILDSDIVLAEELFEPNKLFISIVKPDELFTDAEVGKVYFDKELNCYFIKTPDHLVKQYRLDLPFVKDYTDKEYVFDSNSFMPDILWLDTTGVTESYTNNGPSGGCGSRVCHEIYTEEELGGMDVLEVTGQTNTGDEVYEYKDKNHEELKSTYELYYVPEGETKMGYDSFTASHPLFFWKDPFGNFVRFRKVAFLPMVECGKPVIYLYPEVAMDVNVQVAPNGGFTVTDPEYPDGGWDVHAEPDGTLTTAGAEYPYLFWEGNGINYEMPEEGFVVSKGNMLEFLSGTLEKLGLNEQERADFIEFWHPRMQEAPYYFVTFVNQEVFDALAPLTVSPRPDKVIRVFMDYQPLEHPISVRPLEITTPERAGFTLVEWGGALR
ncbi:MAG: hypothetical protein V1685_00285 [Parcubacteria group bacterium]